MYTNTYYLQANNTIKAPAIFNWVWLNIVAFISGRLYNLTVSSSKATLDKNVWTCSVKYVWSAGLCLQYSKTAKEPFNFDRLNPLL